MGNELFEDFSQPAPVYGSATQGNAPAGRQERQPAGRRTLGHPQQERPHLDSGQMQSLERAERAAWVFPWLPTSQRDAPRDVAVAWREGGRVHSAHTDAGQPFLAHLMQTRPNLVSVVPMAARHHDMARRLGWQVATSTYCLNTMECWANVDKPFLAEQEYIGTPQAEDVLHRYEVVREWFLHHGQVTHLQSEMRFSPYVADMGSRGLLLDVPLAHDTLQAWLRKQTDCVSAFPHINLASPREIQKAMSAQGIHLRSTGASILEDLVDNRGPGARLASACLVYRKASGVIAKLESYLGHVASDQRVYSDWYQHGAATGRMTCRNPALQQVDKKSGLRNLFHAGEGRSLVAIDYSAQDLRVMACLSSDATLAGMLQEPDMDPHAETQRKLGLPSRDVAKILTYALPYGAGVQRIAKLTHLPPANAKAYINALP